MSSIGLVYKREFDLLQRRVEGHSRGYRQNIAIIGRPFIGKTFLVSHLLKVLPENVCSVLIDVKELDKIYLFRSFATSLLCSYLSKKASLLELTSPNLEELLERIKEKLPKTYNFILNYKFENMDPFLASFGLAELFLKESGHKLVYVIENFDFLSKLGLERCFEFLATQIMRFKDIMFVITSSSVYRAEKILDNELSLLFGNFEKIILGSISPAVCRDYLLQSIPEIPTRIHKFLYYFTGASPYYLDILCRSLRDNNSCCDWWDKLIDVIYQEVFCDIGRIYQHFLRWVCSLSDGPKGPQVSTFLLASTQEANIEKLSSKFKWQRQVLSHKVDVLKREGIIYTDHNVLFFEDSLFRFWLKYVYRHRIEHPNLLDEDFKKWSFYVIKSEIAKFIEEDSVGEIKKIILLFKSFDDRFIMLADGKKHRFYKFTEVEIVDERLNLCKAVSMQGYVWVFAYQRIWDEEKIFLLDDLLKNMREKLYRKIIIFKEDITSQAKVVAKEKGLWMWSYDILNHLLELHNIGAIVW